MCADFIRISVRFDGNARMIAIRKYAQVHELFKLLRKEVDNQGNSSFTVIYHGQSLEEGQEGDIDSLGYDIWTLSICASKRLEVVIARRNVIIITSQTFSRKLDFQHVPERSVAYSTTTFQEKFALGCLVDAYTVLWL